MLSERLSDTLNRLRNAAEAAKRPMPTLVAVSKFHPAQAVAELAAAGQRVFGENYVQEAQAKRAGLSALALEWHLIGHLQSNKAALAAELFDWVQTVDRPKLVAALAAARSPQRRILVRRAAFVRMKQLFDALAARHAGVDTLSMGMSEDCALAVAEGATMVRVGTALFGARPVKA